MYFRNWLGNIKSWFNFDFCRRLNDGEVIVDVENGDLNSCCITQPSGISRCNN